MKRNKQKSQQKGRRKVIQLVLTDIEWSDHLSTKKKGIASQPTSEERSRYLSTRSEIQISPKEHLEVTSLFLIIKAKLPARALHHQEKKKMNEKFVMH